MKSRPRFPDALRRKRLFFRFSPVATPPFPTRRSAVKLAATVKTDAVERSTPAFSTFYRQEKPPFSQKAEKSACKLPAIRS